MTSTVGQKVTVVYDARPLHPRTESPGEIVKISKTGMLTIKTESPIYSAQKFYPCLVQKMGGTKRFAKGWNTLWWEPRGS